MQLILMGRERWSSLLRNRALWHPRLRPLAQPRPVTQQTGAQQQKQALTTGQGTAQREKHARQHRCRSIAPGPPLETN